MEAIEMLCNALENHKNSLMAKAILLQNYLAEHDEGIPIEYVHRVRLAFAED